jgi:very-short-patch-repair endonuclease
MGYGWSMPSFLPEARTGGVESNRPFGIGRIMHDYDVDYDSSPIEDEFWDAYNEMKPVELRGMVPQHCVGKYRLDFAIPHLKVGIELDGHATHSSALEIASDRRRQRDLERSGWHIIRFGGSEVFANAEECVREAAELVELFNIRMGNANNEWLSGDYPFTLRGYITKIWWISDDDSDRSGFLIRFDAQGNKSSSKNKIVLFSKVLVAEGLEVEFHTFIDVIGVTPKDILNNMTVADDDECGYPIKSIANWKPKSKMYRVYVYPNEGPYEMIEW